MDFLDRFIEQRAARSPVFQAHLAAREAIAVIGQQIRQA